ncbi:MAG: pilus assembly protein [Actinomycetospora chiangmaiensis]|nr:pilus assembly protein [Actinomycetospora chiangmaiensis]
MSRPAPARLLARLRALRAREDGMAATEFALMLPLLLLMYVGTVGVTSAVSASRATVVLARTLTDLVSQQAANVALTDSTTSNIFNASTAVMAPFSIASLKMTLSNVEFVANPAAVTSGGLDAKTRWSVSLSNGPLRPCRVLTPVANGSTPSATTMPQGIYAAGFVIVADVSYTYTPSFGYFTWTFANDGTTTSPLSFTMARTTYMRPRQTDNVRYTSGQSATICPIAAPQAS